MNFYVYLRVLSFCNVEFVKLTCIYFFYFFIFW